MLVLQSCLPLFLKADCTITSTQSHIQHATALKHMRALFFLQVPELQLPIRFDTDVGGELADSAPGVGRIMTVSFNRCLAPEAPDQARLLRAGLLARRARTELLLAQLGEASAAPEVDFVNPVIK